jgi:hypothetical protein
MEPEREADAEFPAELEQLGARILRPDQRVSCEDLIADELAMAVRSNPLQKVRHSCEAIMLLGPGELKQANITQDDVETAKKLHELALDLTNLYVHQLKDRYGEIRDDYASIPWSFKRSEAKAWFEAWASDLEFIVWHSDHPGDAEREAALAKIEDKFERMYAMTKAQISVSSARAFVSRFEAYAMPIAISFMKRTILLVSPDSYRAALAIIRGGRYGKETEA